MVYKVSTSTSKPSTKHEREGLREIDAEKERERERNRRKE